MTFFCPTLVTSIAKVSKWKPWKTLDDIFSLLEQISIDSGNHVHFGMEIEMELRWQRPLRIGRRLGFVQCFTCLKLRYINCSSLRLNPEIHQS